jgi:hypothetical protein
LAPFLSGNLLAQFLLCESGVFDVAIPFHAIEAIPLALVSSQGEGS